MPPPGVVDHAGVPMLRQVLPSSFEVQLSTDVPDLGPYRVPTGGAFEVSVQPGMPMTTRLTPAYRGLASALGQILDATA